MALCMHNDERSSIISSSLSSTTYKRECKDCGRISYITETLIPESMKGGVMKALRRPNLTDEIRKLEGRK